jgi:hypothetical protein
LSQAPTKYILQVKPTIVDGTRYEGRDSVEITLPPGARTAPLVTLSAGTMKGEIQGTFLPSYGISGEGVSIWAIHPSGLSHTTSTNNDGYFSFSDLPMDEYLVTADCNELWAHHLACTAVKRDLRHLKSEPLEIPAMAIEGITIKGTVHDELGIPLFFAWVHGEGGSGIASLNPATGEFTWSGISAGEESVIIVAPGYYSQNADVAVRNATGESIIHIDMEKQPGTKQIFLGESTVIIPPESVAKSDRYLIDLKRGWLWGEIDPEDPLQIDSPGYHIDIIEGRFALEVLPGQPSWLFVLSGEAKVRSNSDVDTIAVTENNMILLDSLERGVPVPVDPTVLAILRPFDYIPVPELQKPSVNEQVIERVSNVGINIAQGVTFTTYSLVILSVPIVLFPLFRWWRKRQRN